MATCLGNTARHQNTGWGEKRGDLGEKDGEGKGMVFQPDYICTQQRLRRPPLLSPPLPIIRGQVFTIQQPMPSHPTRAPRRAREDVTLDNATRDGPFFALPPGEPRARERNSSTPSSGSAVKKKRPRTIAESPGKNREGLLQVSGVASMIRLGLRSRARSPAPRRPSSRVTDLGGRRGEVSSPRRPPVARRRRSGAATPGPGCVPAG
ncbi:uncharacterized protein LOC103054253 [Python bivittatus]|uniref:Uncharacterized protein LOC103054253 n=1 Tax=Python bivittatus TaxID=176946 RepID=A0A9F2WAE8_PYTBI|nr:uncharacterized protein LOC103054253 [Python bivittatus]